MKILFLLFDSYETLDLFGPVEILARNQNHELHYVSLHGGIVESAQHTRIETEPMEVIKEEYVQVIPGGQGTRQFVDDAEFLDALRKQCEHANYILSICTGSALLARAGVLDGRLATSNKNVFDWVTTCSDKVHWVKESRWEVDEKYYTAAGVSAGMDMSLGFMADLYGIDSAKKIAHDIEYVWNDCREDGFRYRD